MPANQPPIPTLRSVAQVQSEIARSIEAITATQQCTLNAALNRICAEDVIAPINVPSFDNSAMDGYAFCSEDITECKHLAIVGSALAGRPFETTLTAGQAIRITTGAKIPARCDSVLPQELATLISTDTLDLTATLVRSGQHIRRCGEDISQGSIAIHKGTRLGPAELGLLASLGFSAIHVFRPLKVAIFSTGDELRSSEGGNQVGSTNATIYDSNRVTLHAMLSRLGIEVVDLGILPDEPKQLETALRHSANDVNAIITSGGVAGGSADFTKQVFSRLGDVHFWSINMRPGRPLAFGPTHKTNDAKHPTYLFGLPGNPVAVMVSFYFFVRPALQQLAGENAIAPLQISAVAQHDIAKKLGRAEFQRGYCYRNAQGQLEVKIAGDQGSGILSSMTKANCMLILPEDLPTIRAGATIPVVLFEGLI
ncbi:molybdopterin molybdotransferase MoeA [Sapientia aquatica]|uniref:Molybdopterin molybdenumtransferase n=1 Tax=Sapientia aquatica TaxID=1549640 RepID=A0A4R5W5R7_9BURK|nr:gephyrin-like molybdotransferase Glp [Sapientia aquatica]TDK68408.1 molybdopterin molybdenumtransferase MoeA [Sapientia aquatica]